jgi:hypothetical protein
MAEFSKEDLIDLAYASVGDEFDGFTVLVNQLTGSSRWSKHYDLVFRAPDGKCYRTPFSVGATEYQDEGPFEHDGDTINVAEVEPYQATYTAYRPVAA